MPEETLLPPFKQWAIVELMGKVRVAGLVTEEDRFGARLGRVDIPNGEGFTTQYFSGASLYRLTPTTEKIARAIAAEDSPAPIHIWELPRQLTAGVVDADGEDDAAPDANRGEIGF